MTATTPSQYVQEAEEAFGRAKELLEVAASHNVGSSALMVKAASDAAGDEIALGKLAVEIARVKRDEMVWTEMNS